MLRSRFNRLDVEFPGIVTETTYLDIRYTDRVVILARTDLNTSQLKIDGTQSENFAARLPISVLGQTLTVLRSWASADIKFRGKSYRFVNAHLESFFEPVQLAQASELLAGPAATGLPVILVGDFNSDAESNGTAYLMLTGGGFTDAWTSSIPTSRFTWPLPGNSAATEDAQARLILPSIEPLRSGVLGEAADDLTRPVQASDHAGSVQLWITAMAGNYRGR